MGASSSKVTEYDRAVLSLKLQRDKLRQYRKKVGIVLDQETEMARLCLQKGDKQRALLLLRHRKYQTSLLDRTDDQLETLERLTATLEFSLVEKDVLYGLQHGNRVLKEIHKEMSIDKVEKILDDSADAIAYQNELGNLLGERISNADEDDVLAEYHHLEQQTNLNLPSVPDSFLAPRVPPEAPYTNTVLSSHVDEEITDFRINDPTWRQRIATAID